MVVCVVIAPDDNIEHLARETAGSPIFIPRLHLTVPSKLPVPVVEIEPADMFPLVVDILPVEDVMSPVQSLFRIYNHYQLIQIYILKPTL